MKSRKDEMLRRQRATIFPGSKIDVEIAPLVRALKADGVLTQGSCSGHGRRDRNTYVAIALNGPSEVARLCSRLQLLESDELFLDLKLIYRGGCYACDFADHPTWLMFWLEVYRPDRQPVDRAQLQKLATDYRRLSRKAAKPTRSTGRAA